jgi:hypothetical protein
MTNAALIELAREFLRTEPDHIARSRDLQDRLHPLDDEALRDQYNELWNMRMACEYGDDLLRDTDDLTHAYQEELEQRGYAY